MISRELPPGDHGDLAADVDVDAALPLLGPQVEDAWAVNLGPLLDAYVYVRRPEVAVLDEVPGEAAVGAPRGGVLRPVRHHPRLEVVAHRLGLRAEEQRPLRLVVRRVRLEPLRVEPDPLQSLPSLQGDHVEPDAGRDLLYGETCIDVAGAEVEHGGDVLRPVGGAELGVELPHPEERLTIRRPLEGDGDHPRLQIEGEVGDVPPQQFPRRHVGGAEGRVPREWELPHRGEYADLEYPLPQIGARDECGLAEVHLPGELLHLRRRPALPVDYHRELVALELRLGEDVHYEERIAQCYQGLIADQVI